MVRMDRYDAMVMMMTMMMIGCKLMVRAMGSMETRIVVAVHRRIDGMIHPAVASVTSMI